MSDDTGHFALSVGCKALKAEADQKGRVGALVTKFVWFGGVRSRPDYSCGKCDVRRARFMSPGVILGLCRAEVQRREAAQEFRASVEVKTGAVPAEVGRQPCQTVKVTGMVHDIEPDWELHDHPNCLAQVVTFPIARYKGGNSSQF